MSDEKFLDGKPPEVMVPKFRPRAGRIRHDVRIMRFWKHKETGEIIEVTSFRHVLPDNIYRVTFLRELPGQADPVEVSCFLKELRAEYVDIGNNLVR